MAKSKESMFANTGVLLVAGVAGLVAAVLFVMLDNYRAGRYELGSEQYVQLARAVPAGKPVTSSDLRTLRIPKPLLETGAFKRAIPASEVPVLVIGKKLRRNMEDGEFIIYADFLPTKDIPKLDAIEPGYEMLTILINPERLLQPGAYVTLTGDFDVDPDPKRTQVDIVPVIYNIKVKSVGGSSEPVTEKDRPADNIQVVLRQADVLQLRKIALAVVSKKFSVSLSGGAGGAPRAEAQFSRDVLDLMQRIRGQDPDAAVATPAP